MDPIILKKCSFLENPYVLYQDHINVTFSKVMEIYVTFEAPGISIHYKYYR